MFFVRYQAARGIPVDGNLRIPTRGKRVLPSVCDVQRIRCDIEICLRIILFHCVGDIFVAKPQVEGEFLSHLEIILNVIELAGLLKGIIYKRRQDGAVEGSEQQIGRS